MHDVRFADGFDGPESVALGLGPAQLLTVVAGLLIAYAVLNCGLPLPLTAPSAGVIVAAAALLGWLRIEGRPALDWLALAVRYAARSRGGCLRINGSPETLTRPAAQPEPGSPRAMSPLPDAAREARRIVFFSLNGGSGRTTLATEVACLLSAERRRVALLDTDPLSGTVAARLGVRPPGPCGHASDVLAWPPAPEALTTHSSGVRVLPACPRPLSHQAQLLEREHLAAVVTRLQSEGVHLIILDVGGDLGPLAIWGLSLADDIYIVLTPTTGGIQDAYRSTELLRRMGHRHKLAYIVNRCGPQDPDLSEVMGDLGGSVTARIPSDPLLEAAESRHHPVALDGRGPAAAALATLAASICGGRHRAGT